MPEEYKRKRARKLVTLPNGDQIYIPVINVISFIDPVRQYQEYETSIFNDSSGNRDVHVDKVYGRDGKSIDVESIDIWRAIDPINRYQESQISFDNRTGGDSKPPHFSTHLKTHIYRYYQDPNVQDDFGVWIDSELIDEYSVIDPIKQYQETIFALNNPAAGDMAGQADPADPDITGGDALIDPPYRTDPFQNIVDYNGASTPGTAEDFLYIMPADIAAHVRSPGLPRESGSWTLISEIGAFSPGDVEAKIEDGTGYLLTSTTDGDILDMRSVEQFFTPHTYDDMLTGEVKGYTYHEWSTGFTPGGLGGIWYDQWVAYNRDVLHEHQPFPNHFDFEGYPWRDLLRGAWIAWNDEAVIRAPLVPDTLNDIQNPFPFAKIRMTAFGAGGIRE